MQMAEIVHVVEKGILQGFRPFAGGKFFPCDHTNATSIAEAKAQAQAIADHHEKYPEPKPEVRRR
jgi:hypothetical protein